MHSETFLSLLFVLMFSLFFSFIVRFIRWLKGD